MNGRRDGAYPQAKVPQKEILRYRVGDLLIDLREKTALREGQPLAMTPLTYKLLAELVRRHPKVVKRDDLIEAVWPGEDVTDQTLSQRISRLRRELGDTAEEPKYVGRAWGWGYRIVAPVTPESPAPPMAAEASAAGAKPPSPVHPVPEAARRPTILVLPFDHLGPTGESSFSAGVSEEITSRLARVPGLAVISRTSALHAVKTQKSIKQMGLETGAQYVLEGSVRWYEESAGTRRIRVTPQLIRTVDDTHVWAQSRDRLVGDPLAAQSDVAESIVRELADLIAEPVSTAELPGLAVLDFLNESHETAIEWLASGLAEAVGTDLAHGASVRLIPRVALVDLKLPRRLGDPPPEVLKEVSSAVDARWVVFGSFRRAGTGLRVRAGVYDAQEDAVKDADPLEGAWSDLFSLQSQTAENLSRLMALPGREGGEARALAASSLEAYRAYAEGRRQFYAKGKVSLEEARQRFEHAVALDPAYAVAHSGLGATYAMQYIHRTDPSDLVRAEGYLRRAIELNAELTEPYPWLCYVLFRKGRIADALAMGRRGFAAQPDNVYAPYFLAVTYLAAAEQDAASVRHAYNFFSRAVEVDGRLTPAWHGLGLVAMGVGDYEGARSCFQAALDLEREGTPLSRFVASDLLMGQLALRQGRDEEAGELFRRCAAGLDGTDHAYREAFAGLCACGSGEVALRSGDAEAASTAFHRAWQTVSEFPHMLGRERVQVAAAAGLASAYARMGDKSRARKLASDAERGLVEIKPQSWFGGAGKAKLAYDTALAWVRMQETPRALACLEAAVGAGWLDAERLRRDPELEPLRVRSAFKALVERIERTDPGIRVEGPFAERS